MCLDARSVRERISVMLYDLCTIKPVNRQSVFATSEVIIKNN